MKTIKKMGLALLVIGCLGLIVPGLEAATIKVNCDKGESVQKELDKLDGPATIVVTGTCRENIDIMKDDVTIQGGTFWGPDSQQSTIYVESARRVLINGATVGGNGVGVTASQGASLTLDNTLIEGNARQGVVVTDNSALILTNSTINRNGAAGVVVQRSSSARIGRNRAGVWGLNTITSNGGSGVNVTRSAYALIDGNTITYNSGNGVNIEGASATVTSNTVANNNRGISVDNSGSARIGVTEAPEAGGNTIVNNTFEGIQSANGAAAYILANTIQNNGLGTNRKPGVGIYRATGRLIGGNTIQGNGAHGVSVNQGTLFQGLGDFTLPSAPIRDIITENGYSGISGWNGANLDIRQAHIYGNNENGIVLNLRSTLRIYDSTVSSNLHDGILIYRGSAVILSTDGPVASVTGNVGWGVFCDDAESSLAGNVSGVTGNGAGPTSCTGF